MHNDVVTFVLILLVGLWLNSCSTKEESFDVSVDLAGEIGSGLFSPEDGDSIFIAGNFNEWSTSKNPLRISGKTWVYGVNVNELVDIENSGANPADTLEFKFYIKSNNPSKLLNAGWESIENRKHVIGDLIIEKPVLLFNDIHPVEEKKEVTFTVGMSNQKVLGFFEPDSGDIVMVTGSFIDWNPLGIPLQKARGQEVYSATIPISGEIMEYKFRILSKRPNYHPAQGWEQVQNRVLNTNRRSKTGFKFFDDISRVVRFQIDAVELISKGDFNPDIGDQLQIKMEIDGRESLSEYLYQVDEFVYEAAVIVPENAISVRWKVVKNNYEDISRYEEIPVPVYGYVKTEKI